MAQARIFNDDGVYHLVSRVVNREKIFGHREKEFFVDRMLAYARFCEVRLMAWCVMGNHFHILCRVERVPELTDEQLIERLRLISRLRSANLLKKELERLRTNGDTEGVERLRGRYLARMGDVSVFMKELKQCFSLWYNRRVGRRGTLWEERFKSVAVEKCERALTTVAAYIELNPLRASLVEDPKDYRHSSYGAAEGGNPEARRAVTRVYGLEGQSNWRRVGRDYRMLLFDQADEIRDEQSGELHRRGLRPEAIRKVFEEGGRLNFGQIVRCRVRYFVDGAAIGGESFLTAILRANRAKFGPDRTTPGYRLRGAEFGNLMAARGLQRDVIHPPT